MSGVEASGLVEVVALDEGPPYVAIVQTEARV